MTRKDIAHAPIFYSMSQITILYAIAGLFFTFFGSFFFSMSLDGSACRDFVESGRSDAFRQFVGLNGGHFRDIRSSVR